MELKVKPRRWGNSIAVIIPKVVADANNIKTGEDTIIEFKKRATAENLFGKLKGWKKSGQQIKNEMKKGW